MRNRKGIILAGGSGTRLQPLTNYVCKQLLPIYDKPLIWYPLFALIHAGIRDIMIISTPETTPILENALGDGSQYGIRLSYKIQHQPNGLAQAFIIAAQFIGNDPCCLILGDNIFYGNGFAESMKTAVAGSDNIVFGYQVSDPSRYGVVEFDDADNIISIEEKPALPKTNYAVPGVYFYENSVIDIAMSLKPSARGEYEITDVNREYIRRNQLKLIRIGIGNAWLDAGTFSSLNDASNFVRTIQDRTGLKVCDITQFKQ